MAAYLKPTRSLDLAFREKNSDDAHPAIHVVATPS